MKNFLKKGEVLDYPIASNGTAVASGELVIVGELKGIATTNIAAGDTGSLNLKGVYSIAKDTGVAVSQGDKLYYVTSTKSLNKTASGNTYAGIAAASALSADTSVLLLLNNGI